MTRAGFNAPAMHCTKRLRVLALCLSASACDAVAEITFRGPLKRGRSTLVYNHNPKAGGGTILQILNAIAADNCNEAEREALGVDFAKGWRAKYPQYTFDEAKKEYAAAIRSVDNNYRPVIG